MKHERRHARRTGAVLTCLVTLKYRTLQLFGIDECNWTRGITSQPSTVNNFINNQTRCRAVGHKNCQQICQGGEPFCPISGVGETTF